MQERKWEWQPSEEEGMREVKCCERSVWYQGGDMTRAMARWRVDGEVGYGEKETEMRVMREKEESAEVKKIDK